MINYKYEGMDSAGKAVKGTVSADGIDQARAKLKQQGYSILSLEEETIWSKDISFAMAKKVPARDLSVFCRQFVSMSRAGVPLLDCLDMLWKQTENPVLVQAIRQVHADVQKGEQLAESMKKLPNVFPDLFITTVAAGEASGSLDTSLERMAEQFEKSAKTAGLVKKAMVYPVVVLIIALIVVVVMLVAVIPSYVDMFDDLGAELPAITKAVMAASDFIIQYWYAIIIAVGAIAIGVGKYVKTPSGQLLTSQLSMRIPVVNNLVVKSASSQLARTLSTLLAAGVPLTEAVEITSDTMTNVLMRDALIDARDEVMKGSPLSAPLEECGLFPPMLYHMIGIGEESGSTEEMLSKLADYYDEEVELATQSLMAAMEPMIIIVLAVIVCVLIAAVMSPMMTMYDALDNL